MHQPIFKKKETDEKQKGTMKIDDLPHQNLSNEVFHIVFVGVQGVGKTSIINRYFDPDYHFNRNQLSTSAVLSYPKLIKHNNQQLRAIIYDTPGAKILQKNVHRYIVSADVIVLVISTVRENTWETINAKLQNVRNQQTVILFWNKIDKAKRQGNFQKYQEMLEPMIDRLEDRFQNFYFQKGSAKKQKYKGINDMMTIIIKDLQILNKQSLNQKSELQSFQATGSSVTDL